MKKLNVYQKIRIALLVLIIIAFVVLIITICKKKNSKEYIAQEVSSDYMNVTEEPDIEPEEIDEEVIEETEEVVDNSWDTEDAPETKVTNEEVKKNNKATYYIKINYTANVVTIYTKDANGDYTVPVKAMVCSTGTATPKSGTYAISYKYRWLGLFGNVQGQYCTRITGHILFHSVPYLEQSPDTLEYWEYDKLGTSASQGCIRLTVADALWIYNNCSSGTYVEFYSSSDPGPLGKPSAQKISSIEACRNWDPTDSAANNPWRSYTGTSTNVENNSSSEEVKNTTSTNQEKENKVQDNKVDEPTVKEDENKDANNEKDDDNKNVQNEKENNTNTENAPKDENEIVESENGAE